MTSTGPEVKCHTSNKRSPYFVVKPSMRENLVFYWKLHSPKIEPSFSDNWVCPLIGNLRYGVVFVLLAKLNCELWQHKVGKTWRFLCTDMVDFRRPGHIVTTRCEPVLETCVLKS